MFDQIRDTLDRTGDDANAVLEQETRSESRAALASARATLEADGAALKATQKAWCDAAEAHRQADGRVAAAKDARREAIVGVTINRAVVAFDAAASRVAEARQLGNLRDWLELLEEEDLIAGEFLGQVIMHVNDDDHDVCGIECEGRHYVTMPADSEAGISRRRTFAMPAPVPVDGMIP